MVHPTTRATAAAISAATPLPAVLADIAAGYVLQPQPQPLPHDLFSARTPPPGKADVDLHLLSSFARIPLRTDPI